MAESKGMSAHQEREEEKEEEKKQEKQQDKEEQTIPAPPSHRKHRRKHWDHLPGSKRKQIRSYRSPGRK